MSSLRASAQGLDTVEQARKKKGWTKTATSWCQAALTTEATLKRFWRQVPIQSESFTQICQAVGVKWEEVVDKTLPTTGLVRMDWEQPMDVSVFYGREKELNTLERMIVTDRYRLITVSGMGGIGKTALVAKIWERVKGDFECAIERSLRTTPACSDLLADWIEFLSEGEQKEGGISQLMEYLRKYRCLLVLDDMESLLRLGKPPGLFRPEYEDYAELVKRVKLEQHQSCLLLMSREPPQDAIALRGDKVGALQLTGLGTEATALLESQGLTGSYKDLLTISELYGGNPLSLNLISTAIQDLFDGKVSDYLKQGTVLVVLHEILEQHFLRLSELEINILVSLATQSESYTLQQLAENCPSVATSEVMVAVQSLVRRALIEKISGETEVAYALQPEVRKYVIKRCVRTKVFN